MARMVLGVFSDREDAEIAINRLEKEGYNPKDISLVMKNKVVGEEMGKRTGADVAGSTVQGVTAGAVLGGLAGLLSAFFIPGLGALFIGGPIAAALGLTGAAATTVSGAATGALAGGLIGALTSWGVPEEDAAYYQDRIETGAILVAIPAAVGRSEEVKEMLEESGAEDVRSFGYDSDKTREYDSPRAAYYSEVRGNKSQKKADVEDWDDDDDLL